MKSRAAAFPYAVWMVLFTLVPMGIVCWFAFTNADGGFTLENVRRIGDYSASLLRSIGIGAASTAICLILAYPLAFSISRSKGRAQQTMVMMIMLPMWMNFLLRTYAWQTILDNNSGVINQLLKSLGLAPLELMNTTGAVILGTVYNFLPFMVLPIYSVMVKIDKHVIEAAQDLGSNHLQVFLRVIFPLSIPGIVSGITMVFVPAVSTFVISKMLGGSKSFMIGDNIEMLFFGNASNYNVGAALALVLMLLMLACMVLMNRIDNGEETGVTI